VPKLSIVHVLPPNSKVTTTSGGAVERIVLSLAERQSRLGHKVVIFSANETESITQIHNLQIRNVRVRLPRPMSDFEYLIKVKILTRKSDHEVLHAHSSPFAAIILARPRTISIATLNYFFFKGSRSRLGRHLYRYVLGKFSQVTSITEFSAKRVAEYYRLAEIPQVLNCGVDLREFRPYPSDTRTEFPEDYPEGPVILYVGRINQQKGSHFLDPLARRLKESGVSVVACGPLKQFHSKSKDPRENILGPSVIYLGTVEQAMLPRLMAAADILILPTTEAEMFGMVLIEAGACGTPAVASRLDAIPEVLSDAGMTFTPGSVDEMYLCVMKILNDGHLLNELSIRAIKNAQRYDWDRIVKDSIIVYEAELTKTRC
jgi:glycosyltransferase involved in cell wall biosynthesis